MDDVRLVHLLHTAADLYKIHPDSLGGHGGVLLPLFGHKLRQISVFAVFHDDDELVAVEEGLVVRCDVLWGSAGAARVQGQGPRGCSGGLRVGLGGSAALTGCRIEARSRISFRAWARSSFFKALTFTSLAAYI